MVRLEFCKLLDSLKLAKDSPLVATHYGLDGRKYHITQELNKSFLTDMSYALFTKRSRLYLIERKTDVFKMHMDLDFIQRTPVSLEDVKTLTRMLTVIMRSFYAGLNAGKADTLFTSVILGAPSKKSVVEGTEIIKSGYHVIWPFLKVTTSQALAMRYACVADAEQRLPLRESPANAYSDILDECVLKANGLRMLGNDKCSPCECAKQRDSKRGYVDIACDVCNHTRYIPEWRPYYPLAMLDGAGNRDAAREPQVLGIELHHYQYKVLICSTRQFSGCTLGFEQPLLAPCAPIGKLKRARGAIGGADRSLKKMKDGVEIGESTETFAAMQAFLRGRMGEAYENIVLKKMVRMARASRDYYMCNVAGGGSSFCANVARAHAQSHIYFRVDDGGSVFQRCYCTKNNAAGTRVACKYYSGPPVQLSASLRLALFTGGVVPVSSEACLAGPVSLKLSKLAAIDSTLDHIEQHILEKRSSGASLTATRDAVASHRVQESRLVNITGRSISKTAGVSKQAAMGLNYSWREVDGLSMRELRLLDETRAREQAAAAVRMHHEVFPVEAAAGGVAVAKTKPVKKEAMHLFVKNKKVVKINK